MSIAGIRKQEWDEDNIEHVKQYRENNKERIQQRMNQYKQVYNKLTIVCECCNKEVNITNLARHQTSNNCRNNRDTSSNISTSTGS